MRRRSPRAGLDYETSVALVLKDYHTFLARAQSGDTPADPKDFAARHAAARGALAHLEHLFKLAGPDDTAAGEARQALLEAARAELGAAEGADDRDE